MNDMKWYIRVEDHNKEPIAMLGPFESQAEAWNSVQPFAFEAIEEGKPVSFMATQLPPDPFMKKHRARTV